MLYWLSCFLIYDEQQGEIILGLGHHPESLEEKEDRQEQGGVKLQLPAVSAHQSTGPLVLFGQFQRFLHQ
jgi:hypothetical protein